MHVTATLLVLVITSGSSVAQQGTTTGPANTVRLEEGAARPPASISQVSWLTGSWQGEGLGGAAEETWSAPAGGSMVGYFRLVKEGRPIFYEIMTIIEVDGSLELRLKHVNPDMTGWEEKSDFVRFKLARIEPDAIYFSGLTFRRAGPDRLEIYLELRNRSDGAVREEQFTLTRGSTRR